MFEITQTFSHESGFEITPFYMEGQGFIFLPKELENQLGYDDLAKYISKSESFAENLEYIILHNSKLMQFKELLNSSTSSGRVQSLLGENFKHSPSLIVLTESGLYTAIILSRKPNAEAFRRWITCEVLPSIREKGFYQSPSSAAKLSTINTEVSFKIDKIEYHLQKIVDKWERQFQKFAQDNTQRLDQIEAVLSECKKEQDVFGGWKRIKMLVDDMTEIYELTVEDRRKYFYKLCQEHDICLPEKAILAIESLYYDAKEIAHKLGIYSKQGKPHVHVVSAIIRHLKLDQEKYCQKFPLPRGTCQTLTVKYSSQVLDAIQQWLKENQFPEKISFLCGKAGKEKKFDVKYRKQK